MDETEASISKTEAEIKANDGGPDKKAAEAEPEACSEPVEEKEKSDPGPVPEGTEPGFVSIAKPLVEGLTQEARALVENVLPSSTDVSEVEKQLEKMVLVSDPWAALKNLGHSQTPETCETLATSDKNVGESSDAANKPSTGEQTEKADVDENPRGVKNQPFLALTAGNRASWMNCCGLLDIFNRSD